MPIRNKKLGEKIVNGIKKLVGKSDFIEKIWAEKRWVPAGLILALIFKINGVPSRVLRGVAHNRQTETDEITTFSRKTEISDLPHKYYDAKKNVKLWKQELENLQKEVNSIYQIKTEFYKTILKQYFSIDVGNLDEWLKS